MNRKQQDVNPNSKIIHRIIPWVCKPALYNPQRQKIWDHWNQADKIQAEMSSDRKQGGLLGQRQDRQVKNRQGRSQSLKGRLLTSQKTLNRWEEDVGDHSKTLSLVNGGSLKGGTHRGEDLWIPNCFISSSRDPSSSDTCIKYSPPEELAHKGELDNFWDSKWWGMSHMETHTFWSTFWSPFGQPQPGLVNQEGAEIWHVEWRREEWAWVQVCRQLSKKAWAQGKSNSLSKARKRREWP